MFCFDIPKVKPTVFVLLYSIGVSDKSQRGQHTRAFKRNNIQPKNVNKEGKQGVTDYASAQEQPIFFV